MAAFRSSCRQRIILIAFAALWSAPAHAAKVYWPEYYSAGIYRSNPDGSDRELLFQFQRDVLNPKKIAIDLNAGKLYLTASRNLSTLPEEGVYRSNLDGTALEQLVGDIDGALAIAVDPIGSKVYWSDYATDRIQRANLDGSNVEDVISTSAGTIVVDSDAAKLYWYGGNPNWLRRANLDGSGVEELLADVNGRFALDLQANQIYWIDGTSDVIRRANLDGSNIEDLVVGYMKIPQGIALDLDRGKMYWADQSFKIHRADLDGSNVERIVDPEIHIAHAPTDIAVVVFGSCGDGLLDTFGEWDDGDNVDADGCQAGCLLPECGDGIVDAGEACDDRNNDGGDGCSPICEVEQGWACEGALSECAEICGDSIIVGSEECDDGNTFDADGCQGDCRLPICGDDIVDPDEECDDGDAVDGNGCDTNCTLTACGNGIVTPGEQCDDGNDVDACDGCSNSCTESAFCGDGTVDLVCSEQCDDGNNVDADGCQSTCALPFCGDGIQDPGELCDDGNAAGGDGCEVDCTLTPAVLLYGQIDQAANGGAYDQAFEPYYVEFDSEGADDFEVTDPEGWDVFRVDTVGLSDYGDGSIHVNIAIYPDAAGMPASAPVCDFPEITNYTENAGNLSILLPQSCKLAPGVYWLAQQVRQDYDSWGLHYWSGRLAQNGNPGVWRNPGGGFGTGCADWTPRTACGFDGPDYRFEIFGVPSQSNPVPALGPLGLLMMIVMLGGGCSYVVACRRREMS